MSFHSDHLLSLLQIIIIEDPLGTGGGAQELRAGHDLRARALAAPELDPVAIDVYLTRVVSGFVWLPKPWKVRSRLCRSR